MDDEKFNKKFNNIYVNKCIHFLSFSSSQSELQINDVKNLKKNEKFSSFEMDFFIKEILKDFSNSPIEILIISYNIFIEIMLDTTNFRNFLKGQDVFKENLLITFLNEDNSWSVLFVKDFLSIFKEDFLYKFGKKKNSEKMRLFYIHKYLNPDKIISNFKISVETFSRFIEYYSQLVNDNNQYINKLKSNFSEELDYKFIYFKSLFNIGNMPLLIDIFKNNDLIETIRELTLNFNCFISLKVDNFLETLNEEEKNNDKNYNQDNNSKELKAIRSSIHKSSSLIAFERREIVLSPINKKYEKINSLSFTCFNMNNFQDSLFNNKERYDKVIQSSLIDELSLEEKQKHLLQKRCTKISVDDTNYEYLNTEESLNHYRDNYQKEQNFSTIHSIIKEEYVETENLDYNQEIINDHKYYKEVLLKQTEKQIINNDLLYNKYYENSHDSMNSEEEDILVNRQLNIEYLSVIKPTLEITSVANINYNNIDNYKKEYPYQIEDDDLFFNNLDLTENNKKKSKTKKSRLLKKQINKEINQLKNLKTDNYLFNLKGRLNPSSNLDIQIKKELGFRNKNKKVNYRIIYEKIDDLYDSEKEEIKGCLAYANSKCIIN